MLELLRLHGENVERNRNIEQGNGNVEWAELFFFSELGFSPVWSELRRDAEGHG